jgi:vanillate O-demethylase ferredoxin subunit
MAKPIKTVSTVIRQIDDLGADTRRFILADQDDWDLPPFKPGAHIDLHLAPGLVRTYSLCNEPEDNRRYVIAVKREQDGRGGSKFMHERLNVGDRVGVSIPRGGIVLSDDAMNMFVAGGIGVTPFISAIRHLERHRRTNYVLHWASRGRPVLFDMIANVSESARVNLYDTSQVAKPAIGDIVAAFTNSGRASCCGPVSMLEAFEGAVESWPEDRKHVERFIPPKRIVQSDVLPYELVLAASKTQMTVLPELGLLGTLEALGADVPVSCGGGICGACRTRWLEGPPVHRDRVLSPAERQSEMIVCVGDCAGPRLVLDL